MGLMLGRSGLTLSRIPSRPLVNWPVGYQPGQVHLQGVGRLRLRWPSDRKCGAHRARRPL